jgi:cephalosporin hydroxylase
VTERSLVRRLRGDSDWYKEACNRFGLYQKESEIVAFLRLAQRLGPTNACELGTWNGGTTFLLANLLPSLRVIIGVDRLIQNADQMKRAIPDRVRLDLIEGPSAERETVERVRNALRGEPLDLLFIDADHSYAAVRKDFEAYSGLVRPGGIIALHDIIPDFRSRFGTNEGAWSGDVPTFWNEIKVSFRYLEFVEDPDQNAYGLGVIFTDGHENLDEL